MTLAAYPGRTLEELRRPLGISQPGTVKLVDRLAERGWVERRAGASGRSVSIVLTGGEEALDSVLAARRRALGGSSRR